MANHASQSNPAEGKDRERRKPLRTDKKILVLSIFFGFRMTVLGQKSPHMDMTLCRRVQGYANTLKKGVSLFRKSHPGAGILTRFSDKPL